MTSTVLGVATGVLGGIYLASALSKLPTGARTQFFNFIRSLYPTSTRHSSLLAAVIAWEVLLGTALITGLGPPPVWLLLSLVTLVLFTGALVLGARRPQPVPCACFGPWSRRPVGRSQVLRNVILVAATGAVGALSSGAGWFMAGTAVGALLLGGWAAVAVSSPVRGTAELFSPPIAAPLPQNMLHQILRPSDSLPGRPASPVDDTPAAIPFLIVFVSAGCGGCERAIALLGGTTLRCRLAFGIDPSGPPDHVGDLERELRSAGRRVLDADLSRELQAFLQVTAYPSHLLLGATGRTLDTGIAISDLIHTINSFDLGMIRQDARAPQ